MPPPITVVAGPEALSEFRQGLTGERALQWLKESEGRLLITLPVGVGKSELLVKTVIHMRMVDRRYDLIVVLVPRWDILREILRKLPSDLSHITLEPRPRSRCGDLDAPWAQNEAAGCGLLARDELCRICPRREGCPWPGQYSKGRLDGAPLVFATQQHLSLNPGFVGWLRHQTGAERVLVLLDEADLLVQPTRRTIERETLEQFLDAQEAVLRATERPTRAQRLWLDQSRLVAEAATADLQRGRWRFPRIGGDWALAVQRAGRDKGGPAFRFLAYDLDHFARSDPASRERTAGGDLQFACPTDLGDDFIIFSGTIARGLARYRLDPDHRRPGLYSPLEGYCFSHPATRWYNIASIAGAAKYFVRNARAILYFFAVMIARNIGEGRRTLLVAKKAFRGLCAEHLRRRLRELGVGPVRVVTGDWDQADLDDPRTLPLINYGLSGVNRFEHCDAAYCLTGYYVNEATVAEAVHDLDASTERYPVRIRTAVDPPRRTATVELPDDREAIVPQVARWVLEQKEADVVVQAVGRVRPFTQPREIITFHAGALPEVRPTLQFRTLGQARSYFGIPTRRRSEAESRAAAARRLKALGLSHARVAEELGVSLATVKRYLRSGWGS
jgi:hypothetical protein